MGPICSGAETACTSRVQPGSRRPSSVWECKQHLLIRAGESMTEQRTAPLPSIPAAICSRYRSSFCLWITIQRLVNLHRPTTKSLTTTNVSDLVAYIVLLAAELITAGSPRPVANMNGPFRRPRAIIHGCSGGSGALCYTVRAVISHFACCLTRAARIIAAA